MCNRVLVAAFGASNIGMLNLTDEGVLLARMLCLSSRTGRSNYHLKPEVLTSIATVCMAMFKEVHPTDYTCDKPEAKEKILNIIR